MNGHSETDIRLVGAVFVHRVVPAHTRHRVRNINPEDILEHRPHHSLEHIQDILLLDEGHLTVDLGELRLTVGAQILVTEAADDLEIAVVAGHHQQLLEGLRRLRKGVELSRIHPGWHDKVAGSLRSGLDQVRSLDLHEVVGIEVVAHLVGKPVPQGQRLLERIPSQVKVTELGAEILAAVALVLDGERRHRGLVEDVYRLKPDLDVACTHLRVLALTLDYLTGGLDDIFTAQRGRGLHQSCVCVRLKHELRDAIAVTQVNESHSAELPGPLHPTGKGHLLPDILNAEFPACVCSVHIDMF